MARIGYQNMSIMINANELRIGNIVAYDEKGMLIKEIIGIPDVNFVDTGYRKLLSVEKIFPIPLVEWWMFEFDFGKKDRMQFGGMTFIYKKLLPNGDWFELNERFQILYATGYKVISYVHQLQNLFFALTGEELKQKNGTN